MQSHGDLVLADSLQRALRHPDLRLVDVESLLRQRLGDVVVGHRAEQPAVDPGLGRDLDGGAVHLLADRLRGDQAFRLRLFEIRATRLEFLDRRLGGAARLALRDQEVSRVAFLDLDHIAQLAEVDDLFQQNDLHDLFPGNQCVSVYGSSARKRARLIAVSS